MANTLFEFFQQQGQRLPSIQDRARTFEQAGLGSAAEFGGTAEQNTMLLNFLKKQQGAVQQPSLQAEQERVFDAINAQAPEGSDLLNDAGAIREIAQTPQAQTEDVFAKGIQNIRDTMAKFQESFSPTANQDFFTNQAKVLGIEEDRAKLLDFERIMEGTPDDIRAELESVGALVTESGVAHLTGARNKVLLRQATFLQRTLQSKEEMLDRLVQAHGLDRAEASKMLDRELDLTGMIMDLELKKIKSGVDFTQELQKEAQALIQAMLNTGGLTAKDDKGFLVSDERLAQLAKDSGWTLEDLKAMRAGEVSREDMERRLQELQLRLGGDGPDSPLTLNQIEQFRRSYGWTPPPGFSMKQLTNYMNDNPNLTPEELERGAREAILGIGDNETQTILEEVLKYINDSLTDDDKSALFRKAQSSGVAKWWRHKDKDVEAYIESIKPQIEEAVQLGYTAEEIKQFLIK